MTMRRKRCVQFNEAILLENFEKSKGGSIAFFKIQRGEYYLFSKFSKFSKYFFFKLRK
jgi:hypothetical protein